MNVLIAVFQADRPVPVLRRWRIEKGVISFSSDFHPPFGGAVWTIHHHPKDTKNLVVISLLCWFVCALLFFVYIKRFRTRFQQHSRVFFVDRTRCAFFCALRYSLVIKDRSNLLFQTSKLKG